MRYGFFHGIDGDSKVLAAALELLADCDRIVCLGGLVGPPVAGEAAALEQLQQAICLGGPGERRRARDTTLPPGTRALLQKLPEATVIDGIAALGHAAPRGARQEMQALGGAPRLVAPVAIAAGKGSTRLWRATGGLQRVEELTGPVCIPLAGARLRLDLGPARGADGVVRVAVVDRDAGVLKLRERVLGRAATPPTRRRMSSRQHRAVAERQLMLAV